jgi:DNA repair exonuclease SbcCD ATPase subunit
LQDDKKRLQEENDRLATETTGLKKEIDDLKVRLEETEWGLCQKSGELSHVKSQLKDTQVSSEVARGQKQSVPSCIYIVYIYVLYPEYI